MSCVAAFGPDWFQAILPLFMEDKCVFSVYGCCAHVSSMCSVGKGWAVLVVIQMCGGRSKTEERVRGVREGLLFDMEVVT